MTITDEQVDAAIEAYESAPGVMQWKAMRAALEAAERAAWCDDMSKAPKDARICVAPSIFSDRDFDVARFDSDAFAKNPRPFWRRDYPATTIASRRKPPTRWRHLPDPPKGE